MRVKKIIFSSGERYGVLVDSDEIPLDYPNLFVTVEHRNASDAPNTCLAVLEQLKYFLEICGHLDIDIEERCAKGEFLSRHEVEQLVYWAKRTVESFRDAVARAKAENVVALNTKRLETARHTIIIDEGTISSHTAYNRLTTFANYVHWLEQYLYPSKVGNTKDLIKGRRPAKFHSDGDEEQADNYKSLEKMEYIRVLDVIRPDSSENPWKEKKKGRKVDVRYRNQLIVNILFAFGCRKGEMLNIKLSDYDSNASQPYIQIRRNSGDKEDKRSNQPVVKTRSRKLGVTKALRAMLDEYIVEHRANVEFVEHNPFLIVSHRNTYGEANALSISAVNKIFREISEVAGFHVNPHGLRHTWNDRYSEAMDKLIAEGKITHEKAEDGRVRQNGWVEGSGMNRVYNKRHDRKNAFKVGLNLQEEGFVEITGIIGQYDEYIDM